jgi:aspartyl-tRNA(Asn)/glutamyl-tRNA(Gln) amidotransferase subunit C
MTPEPPLSADDVRRVARLARLAISDERAEEVRRDLAAVVGYVDMLRELDLAGVEPMSHAGDARNVSDDDVPREPLANSVLMKMAPDTMEPFFKVPKVLGEGGGA